MMTMNSCGIFACTWTQFITDIYLFFFYLLLNCNNYHKNKFGALGSKIISYLPFVKDNNAHLKWNSQIVYGNYLVPSTLRKFLVYFVFLLLLESRMQVRKLFLNICCLKCRARKPRVELFTCHKRGRLKLKSVANKKLQ